MLVDIHTHFVSPANAFIKYNRLPTINDQYQFSAGIHPWDAHLYLESNLNDLFDPIIHHKNFFILGEIGIDLVKKENLESQKVIFLNQLIMAKEKNIKRVLIHCVKSLNQILKLLKESGYSGKLIFHDSNFNSIESEQIIKMGHYLSFGKNLFKEKSKAQQSIHSKWMMNYLFETDDSNRSIDEVYQQASELMGISVSVLADQALKNFHHIQS